MAAATTVYTPSVEIVSECAGMCIECGDMPWELYCETCGEEFCGVCFAALHRSGNRRSHPTKKLDRLGGEAGSGGAGAGSGVADMNVVAAPSVMGQSVEEQEAAADAAAAAAAAAAAGGAAAAGELRKIGLESSGEEYLKRCKTIPLRLTGEERKLLVLLEAALDVSEYTDKVDILTYRAKTRIIIKQLHEMFGIVAGLLVTADFKAGAALVGKESMEDNAEFLQDLFEIGRRFKIMNPDKMRTEYGKLLHMLQDSCARDVSAALGFSLVAPIKTVYGLLEDAGGLELLEDEYLTTATTEVSELSRTKAELAADLEAKSAARKHLINKYGSTDGSTPLTRDQVERVILSIADNNAFLAWTRDVVDIMIEALETYFSPDNDAKSASLAIRAGRGGARLTHSHSTQFAYVQQTFVFWRAVQHDFFSFWMLAEDDLLRKDSFYRLRDTGQGLNRVQGAPNVSAAIHGLLSGVQRKLGGWVGSSAIHLGDHCVPNALVFIDKYTQIPRILNPIVTAIRHLGDLVDQDPHIAHFVDEQFGGLRAAQTRILRSFFRHGFDGSGARNFFDAGSCIDGRLTSSWNWASKIEKRAYFPLFLMTGFTGFDGQF